MKFHFIFSTTVYTLFSGNLSKIHAREDLRKLAQAANQTYMISPGVHREPHNTGSIRTQFPIVHLVLTSHAIKAESSSYVSKNSSKTISKDFFLRCIVISICLR